MRFILWIIVFGLWRSLEMGPNAFGRRATTGHRKGCKEVWIPFSHWKCCVHDTPLVHMLTTETKKEEEYCIYLFVG